MSKKKYLKETQKNYLNYVKKGGVKKTRYLVKVKNHIFEIGVFKGESEGLMVAEVELNHEKESFSKPNWLGKEVMGEAKYYNFELSKIPFKIKYLLKIGHKKTRKKILLLSSYK